MKVTVYYQSGRVDIFDTNSFTKSEPFQDGRNIITEFQARFDLLETEGLLIDLFWYDNADNENKVVSYNSDEQMEMSHAIRKENRRIRLVSSNEIIDIAKITLDDELVVWRQGAYLINAIKFMSQELLTYSDATTTSINKRAVSIYEYLRNANPELADENIALMMGYTKQALDTILSDEMANTEKEDEPLFGDLDVVSEEESREG